MSARTWGLLSLACLAAAGCGPARVPVGGSVTLDGKPVERGGVEFVRVGPSPDGRTRAGSHVVNGTYAIPQELGLLPGKYRVEAYLHEPAPGRRSDEGGGNFRHVPLPRYGENSELVVEVRGGTTRLDLNLTR